MNTKYLGILLLSSTLLLGSCVPDTKVSKKLMTVDEATGSTSYREEHPFSDPLKKDNFMVSLSGTKPENMILTFTISNSESLVIYEVKIKGTDLLGSTDPNVDLRKEEDQIKFIQNIAKDFLGKEQFLDPAVTPEQTSDEYAPDKAFYEELRKSGLAGFTYRLGKENNIYIAWSQKDSKVKIYYNCC